MNQDYANPNVRKFIHLYPEVTSKISESWQAEKILNETNSRLLAPMWARGGQHFYIRELAQLRDGRLVFILRFFMYHGVDSAEAVQVHMDPDVRNSNNHATITMPC